jgi:metal transporter CNNM
MELFTVVTVCRTSLCAGTIPLKLIFHPSELKELINMHSAIGPHGGDLQSDTITMVGGALDFQVICLIHPLFGIFSDTRIPFKQEKTVFDAMTPINDVFMLSVESRLDYETLAKVVRSGHSRVPVFEESAGPNGHVSKKIIGILLVKQCVLLDPEGV